ncbi:MAG: DNA repair protein RadC [Alphaproteobacteria bacterium]
MTQTVKEVVPKPHYTGHRQRLRERFLHNGPAAVADYELLEMILFTAKPRGDVKPLAKELLARFRTFGGVLHADPQELQKVAGVGEAALVAIKVAKASAERLLKEEMSERPIVKSWTQLLDYCRLQFGQLKHEEFHVLFLNSKLELIADECLQKGTVNHTPVYPREVVKRALELGASSMILVHNHPSGDVKPSRDDIQVTAQIVQAASHLEIEVHDHVIIGGKKHFSFKSQGLI